MLALRSLLILAAAAAAAQSLSPDLVKKIEATIVAEKSKLGIPGLTVAVAVNNQLRYAKAFGMADLERDVPAKSTTLFRTASIAKAMTAAGVMKLVEQGRLDLDAPVQKYCPEFPEKPWPVTTRQLLGHLGGVRHYDRPGEAAGKAHYWGVKHSLDVFKYDPLLHEPGTRYHYTTFGFTVLGCAIEGASGKTYEEWMREAVWRPAEMERTRIDEHFLVIADRTQFYHRLRPQEHAQLAPPEQAKVKPGAILNAELHDTSMKVPGGGLLSTSTDLVRFGISMNTGALLKKSTVELMWTSQKTADGKDTNYGMGWVISTRDGVKVVSHSGGQAGTSTLLNIWPERGVIVAAMANLDGAGIGGMVRSIGETLLAAK
jgi:CubicO group peptidase (beta-lactamase class C family)